MGPSYYQGHILRELLNPSICCLTFHFQWSNPQLGCSKSTSLPWEDHFTGSLDYHDQCVVKNGARRRPGRQSLVLFEA